MTNDLLTLIDRRLASLAPLPYELARALRSRLAACANEAVSLRAKARQAKAQERRDVIAMCKRVEQTTKPAGAVAVAMLREMVERGEHEREGGPWE